MITPDELLFSVDEHNIPIDPQPRKLSHETGIWHRACHVWIINAKREILCQQRSLLKDSNPGYWEPFFGGHLTPGQEYIDAAIIETQEELGLQITPTQLQFFKEHKYTPGTEFQGIFVLKWDGDSATITLEADEVQQVTWKTTPDVKNEILIKQNSQWTHCGYEEEMLDLLQSQ